MNIKNGSPLVHRMIFVFAAAAMLAVFASISIKQPTVARVNEMEQELDQTIERVNINEDHIQELLAEKYQELPTLEQ